MILSQYLSSNYLNFGSSTSSSSNSTTSADILAKVSKVMEAQTTNVPQINSALSSDNTKLSGLGKLLNALSSFQSSANSFTQSLSTTSTGTQDTSSLTSKVTTLVNQYNTLTTSLNALKQGDLQSDRALTSVQSQLTRALNSRLLQTEAAGGLRLSDLGISKQADGTLSIDASKLQSAVTANPNAVAKMFSNEGKGIAETLASKIHDMVSSTGVVTKETTALNKDVASLNAKRDSMEKALTAQANALATLYTKQGTSGGGGVGSSLLDYL